MVWKILTIIAAVLIAGSAYLNYQTDAKIGKAMADLASEEKKLAGLQRELQDTKDQIVMLNQSILMLNDETEMLNSENITVKNSIVEATASFNRLTSEVAVKKEKLARWQKVADTIPEIEMLRRQMAETRIEIEESETNIVEQEGVVVAVTEETKDLEEVATELASLRSDQNNGIIRSEFQSQITKAYNRWGFVVVEGGDDQGVVHNAQLDVFRRGQYLCRLLVTEVKASNSIADIVPGSLQPGQSVLPGDQVRKSVSAAIVPTAPAPVTAPLPVPDNGGAPAAPTGGGSAPDPFGSGGGSDPFGSGGGGSSMGGGEPDPFGGGGGADPFGGGGGSDPFGSGGEPDPFGN